MIPPTFIYAYLKSTVILPAQSLYREIPGKPTVVSARQARKGTSASYPYLLSLSRLALLSSYAYSFRHRFVVRKNTMISRMCQALLETIFRRTEF